MQGHTVAIADARWTTRRAVVLGAGALGACAVGGGAPETGRLTAEPVMLQYMSWDESRPDLLPHLTEVLNAFTAKHKNIKVEALPPAGAQFQEKIVTLVASGTPPDVAATHFTQVRDLGPQGTVQDLAELLKRDAFPKEHVGWEPYAWRGKQYGVPYGLQGSCIFYNKSLFEAAGMPLPDDAWTWGQFADTARRLVKEDQEEPAKSIWGASDYGGQNFQYMHALLLTYGGGLVNEKLDDFTVLSPASLQGLEFRGSWVPQRRIAPATGSVGAMNNQFMAGTLAMQISGSWFTSNIKASQLNRASWDVAPLPKGPKRRAGLVHAQGIGIPSGPTQLEAAWALVKHLALPESMMPFGKAGHIIPANRKVWETSLPADGVPAGFKKAALDTWEEIASDSPFMPRRADIHRIWQEEMNPVWQGTRAAREGAQNFKTRADAILRELKGQGLL